LRIRIELVFTIKGTHLNAAVATAQLKRLLLSLDPGSLYRHKVTVGPQGYARGDSIHLFRRSFDRGPWIARRQPNHHAAILLDSPDIEPICAQPSCNFASIKPSLRPSRLTLWNAVKGY
jgi:hypothetical protein